MRERPGDLLTEEMPPPGGQPITEERPEHPDQPAPPPAEPEPAPQPLDE